MGARLGGRSPLATTLGFEAALISETMESRESTISVSFDSSYKNLSSAVSIHLGWASSTCIAMSENNKSEASSSISGTTIALGMGVLIVGAAAGNVGNVISILCDNEMTRRFWIDSD